MGINRESDALKKHRSVSVVLPCHNEAIAVHPVLHRLGSMVSPWFVQGFSLKEVVIVDDGSTDGTRSQIERWIAEHAERYSLRVSILTHDHRLGYGAALKTGIAASTGDLIAFYDVDGTYDPVLIPSMVRAMESGSASMACGDRLSRCEHMPLTREIGNRLFVGTINLLFRTRVYDSCTGMRVFSRDLREFFSSTALPNGLDYSLAMTLTFLRTGHRLIEIPIPYARRLGRSKLRVLTDGPRFFMRIFSWWLRTPRQIKVFRYRSSL